MTQQVSEPVSQQSTTTHQVEIDLIARQRFFSRLRFRWGLFGGMIAALITAIVATIAYAGEECVPLYAGFSEWDPNYEIVTTVNHDPASSLECVVTVVDNEPDVVQEVTPEDQTLREHLVERRHSFERYLDDFWRLTDGRDIAGVVRFVSVFIAGLYCILLYRGLSDERYEAEMRPAQYHQMKTLQNTVWHALSGVGIMFALCMITYVVLSASWLLLAAMFEQLALTHTGAILAAAFFAGLVGFLIAFGVIALSTQQLIGLGMITFVVGMAASFAMAGQVQRGPETKFWWQTAISTLGEVPGTDVLFTFVFVALLLVFYVVWFDIADILRTALDPARKPGDPDSRAFKYTRFFYFLAALCLASVGMFPLVSADSRSVYFLTLTLHSVASMVALAIYWLGGMVLLTYRLRHTAFSRGYQMLSYGLFGAGFASGVLLALGLFNLAATELIMFSLCGAWLYAAIDSVLHYGNLKWLESSAEPGPDRYASNPVVKALTTTQHDLLSLRALRQWLERFGLKGLMD